MTRSGHGEATDLPSGPRPGKRDVTFLDDPVVDQLLRAVVTLTMELSVTRERLRSLEQVIEGTGQTVSAAIDDLERTPQEDASRRAAREALIQSVLGPIVSRLEHD